MVAAVRALPEGAYVFAVLAIGVADLAASHAAVAGVRLAHFEPRAFEEEAVAYGSVVSHHAPPSCLSCTCRMATISLVTALAPERIVAKR